jgi:pyruvate-formate lyase-activating enzyme
MARITDEYVKYQRFCRPNIDASHRCIFRCPQCIRQKTTSQEQIKRSFDLEEEQFKKILDYYELGITFCGQISDPIYHPKFLNLLKMCNGQGKAVRIATVGSGKSDAWWDEAYSYGVGENAWYFGVDGIDEKSELYRIGSDFQEVWQRMKQGRDLGHVIVWQYIIFGYNEHEVDRAIEIAKEEDFSLLLINTNRGFNPDSPLLRKNVDFKLTSPDKKHTQQRVKKEYWGYKSASLEVWQRMSRDKMQSLNLTN